MKTRMCPDCRDGKHNTCAGFAFDANDNDVPCRCHRCHPPEPETCMACGARIHPVTHACRCFQN
jgi:hypothetical protein